MKVRSHDPEEAIRHDVIVTIITAAKRDLALVNDQLLGFVRERTLDRAGAELRPAPPQTNCSGRYLTFQVSPTSSVKEFGPEDSQSPFQV